MLIAANPTPELNRQGITLTPQQRLDALRAAIADGRNAYNIFPASVEKYRDNAAMFDCNLLWAEKALNANNPQDAFHWLRVAYLRLDDYQDMNKWQWQPL